MRQFIFFIYVLVLFSCKKGPVTLSSHFNSNAIPPEVDYSKPESWAALPNKIDLADSLPIGSNLTDNQKNAKVDVFFIHPTILTYQPTNSFEWNGDINDQFLNNKTDNSTILNQASAFNGIGKIYAPRYRQAHIYSFFTQNKEDAKQALDLAYSDVKKAFEYYMKNENNGRPIIIASHSQGTVHAKRLLKEYFDGTPLQKKLVMAYIIGIAFAPETFDHLKPTENPTQTGCYAAWNTFATGFYPKWYSESGKKPVCTNPLTWSSAENYVPNSENLGGVGPKFKFYPKVVDAQVHSGLLWVNKPKIRGAGLVNTKVWHIADINFYWMNIRENAAERVNTYFNQGK